MMMMMMVMMINVDDDDDSDDDDIGTQSLSSMYLICRLTSASS